MSQSTKNSPRPTPVSATEFISSTGLIPIYNVMHLYWCIWTKLQNFLFCNISLTGIYGWNQTWNSFTLSAKTLGMVIMDIKKWLMYWLHIKIKIKQFFLFFIEQTIVFRLLLILWLKVGNSDILTKKKLLNSRLKIWTKWSEEQYAVSEQLWQLNRQSNL